MELQYVFNELKDEHEVAIVEKYTCIAKRYTLALTGKAIFINFRMCFYLISRQVYIEKEVLWSPIYILYNKFVNNYFKLKLNDYNYQAVLR